jgi:hypothetical protein
MSASTLVLALNASRILSTSARLALADEQALRLDAEDHGHDHQQHADRDGADGIPHRVAGQDGQPHAREGEHQPGKGSDILEQHDRKLWLLGVADELDPALLAADVVALLDGGAQREALEPDRHHQDDDRQPGVFELVGMLQLLDALVEREDAADGEQDDGHDERVDVALAAVAERVTCDHRAAGAAGCRSRPPSAPTRRASSSSRRTGTRRTW